MDIQDTKKIVRRIQEDAELLKKVIEAEITVGRMLVSDDIYHDIEDGMLIGGNDLATAEVLWRQNFARISPLSNKFGVVPSRQ